MASQQFCTFLLDGLFIRRPCTTSSGSHPVSAHDAGAAGAPGGQGNDQPAGADRPGDRFARRLELGKRPKSELPVNVVVRTPDGAVSLLVDEIGDVIEVEQSSFEEPPETLRGTVRSMILGVHKLKDRLLHLLDTEKACQVQEDAQPSLP